jgi:hypothetical protein
MPPPPFSSHSAVRTSLCCATYRVFPSGSVPADDQYSANHHFANVVCRRSVHYGFSDGCAGHSGVLARVLAGFTTRITFISLWQLHAKQEDAKLTALGLGKPSYDVRTVLGREDAAATQFARLLIEILQ